MREHVVETLGRCNGIEENPAFQNRSPYYSISANEELGPTPREIQHDEKLPMYSNLINIHKVMKEREWEVRHEEIG